MDSREDSEPQPGITPPDDSLAASLDPQPGVVPAPLDWALWLLPLVVLMLLAGTVAISFVPTNLDLLLPLSAWLVLAIALLGVVAWRMIPLVTSPLSNAARHVRNGKLITWNRFGPLLALLLVTILAVVLATGGVFVFALFKPSFYVVNSQVAQPFVLLVTSSVVIILLLFAWLVRFRPLQKLLQMRFAGLGVLVIPVASYLALNSWLPSVLYDRPVYAGHFASWPAMVQFARHEAERIDKDAILYDVVIYASEFHGSYSPETSLFSVVFMFVRPTGAGINISLLDMNPIRLQYVHKDNSANIRSYEYAQERYADWLAYLELGPRDVYSLTEKEAIEFAQSNGIDFAEFWPSLHMTLTSSDNWKSEFGVPAVWVMDYISKTGFESLYLYVDGTTGEVLDRDPYLYFGTATPAPQPAATASPTP